MADEVTTLRSYVESDPAATPPQSAGRVRLALRRLLLRLLRPHTAHQHNVNRHVVGALEELAAAERGMPSSIEQGRLRAQVTRLGAVERAVEELRDQRAGLEHDLEGMRQVIAGARAVPQMWELPMQAFEDDAAGRVYGFRGSAERTEPHQLYRRLDDVFRGPSEGVRERQRPYLDVIGDRSPVVDLGCGRGDFLDALRERGTSYVGVEPDAGMREACLAKGHDAVVGSDANAYLESVGDDSLGVVFLTQVLEHMHTDYLLCFLQLALQKLHADGLLIAEIPNPHSAHTSKIFWVDPTHQSPIFPEVVLALCWAIGFQSAFIFHPMGSGDAEADRFTEPEVAIVATKRGTTHADGSS
jgi:SAM-dependent methyltransferase